SKTDFNMAVLPGELVAGCYPMDLTCTDDEAKVWTVGKVEGNTITLGLIDEQKIEAGRPFILLKGTTDDYDAEADAEKVAFTHGMDIFATPDTINTLRGSFTDVVVGAGVAIPSANHIGISKSPSQKVAANGVWIVSEAGFDTKTAVEIVFDQDAPDGITTALQNVSRNGAIYTIDGRLVSRKGNLNSMQSLPKGTYILNGTKVMVK
ncbi:MAG: hypothetical protein K6C30_03290, partial [Bacteroidaceae bacterium]|nr:hypothetical protein [Bacteroidaceae bacterium]